MFHVMIPFLNSVWRSFKELCMFWLIIPLNPQKPTCIVQKSTGSEGARFLCVGVWTQECDFTRWMSSSELPLLPLAPLFYFRWVSDPVAEGLCQVWEGLKLRPGNTPTCNKTQTAARSCSMFFLCFNVEKWKRPLVILKRLWSQLLSEIRSV